MRLNKFRIGLILGAVVGAVIIAGGAFGIRDGNIDYVALWWFFGIMLVMLMVTREISKIRERRKK